MKSSCLAEPRSRPLAFGAVLEVLGYFLLATSAVLGFALGWLPRDGAAPLVLLWLVSLLALAWSRFESGRHPCFLFLCPLLLFQAGRLAAAFAGGGIDIFRIELMTAYPFDISREAAATVLLSLALSAVCLYAPCRWLYHAGSGSWDRGWQRFLPYLYFLFSLSVPVQLFKNYRYYQYAQDHGGYLVFFIDHAGMAAAIPWPVRAISLISLPALVGIFVLEKRRKFCYAVAVLYFLMTGPLLLIGSRGATFALILSLWYVAKVKSGRRTPWYSAVTVAATLLLLGALIGGLRNPDGGKALGGPGDFVAQQGMSFNVTEVAVAERRHFAPHMLSYLKSELQTAFVASDQSHYVSGKLFSDDMAVFLNPIAYQWGFGCGSSYLAEAYVLAGLWGVAAISVLLGCLLHGMHVMSRHPLGLFLVGMILPDVLWMTRAGLLDWVSGCMRTAVSLALLGLGWGLYRSVACAGSLLRRNHDLRAFAE